MSDDNPEQYAEFATQDGPGSADVEQAPVRTDPDHPERAHPEPEPATETER
jgi:hypothetical protein